MSQVHVRRDNAQLDSGWGELVPRATRLLNLEMVGTLGRKWETIRILGQIFVGVHFCFFVFEQWARFQHLEFRLCYGDRFIRRHWTSFTPT